MRKTELLLNSTPYRRQKGIPEGCRNRFFFFLVRFLEAPPPSPDLS